MKIAKLEMENVKRVRVVACELGAGLNKVGGKNAQGKTSMLDGIEALFAGKGAQQPEMIRRGESGARVVAEVGDLVVERRWTPSGTTVEVRTKSGAVHKSPQAMLDALTNSISFDPLAFTRLDPRKQVAALRELVGVDTSMLDDERAEVYEKRARINASGKDFAAEVKLLPDAPEGTPDEEVSLEALLAEQGEIQRQRQENGAARTRAADLEITAAEAAKAVLDAQAQVEHFQARLAEVQMDLDSARVAAGEARSRCEAAKTVAAALVDPDDSDVRAKLAGFEATNRAVRAKRARAEAEAKLGELRAQSAAATKRLEAIDAEKAKILAEAKWPVAGLGFSADGLTLNGLPFEQASSAEQLRVSLAMAVARDPKLRTFLIRDGSLLDDDSMAALDAFATEHDAQVLIEVVGNPADAALVFVDGMATGPAAVEPTPRKAKKAREVEA